MKRITALMLCLVLCLSLLPAQAEKYETTPDIFQIDYKTIERKEDNNRYFVSKEYLITTNEQVNAELRAAADAFEEQYVSQGYYTNRSIEETLELGWKLLSILPKAELKRIRSAYIEKYYPEEA